MSKPKKETFFWTSYSDLMTSLFFVMLVLFVLVIVLLNNKMRDIEDERIATQHQLDKIKEIEESVKRIDKEYFEYNAQFKRHTLKDIRVSFKKHSSNFNDIDKSQREKLKNAGISIKNFVNEAINKNPEVRYLLIIEGQASKDSYIRNYELSYERALALVKFWEDENISFNDEYCEIIISGSGDGGIFKYGNQWLFRDKENETANQRFVIHIIPKTGVIKN